MSDHKTPAGATHPHSAELSALLDDEAGTGAKEVRQHLATCADCRAEMAEMERVSAALASYFDESTLTPWPGPSEGARAAALAAYAEGASATRRRLAASPWRRALGAAAAVAVVAGGAVAVLDFAGTGAAPTYAPAAIGTHRPAGHHVPITAGPECTQVTTKGAGVLLEFRRDGCLRLERVSESDVVAQGATTHTSSSSWRVTITLRAPSFRAGSVAVVDGEVVGRVALGSSARQIVIDGHSRALLQRLEHAL